MCKWHVRNISREPAGQHVGVSEVLGLDFCGPMSVPSLKGRRRYNFVRLISQTLQCCMMLSAPRMRLLARFTER
jgi:hypothetical protein